MNILPTLYVDTVACCDFKRKLKEHAEERSKTLPAPGYHGDPFDRYREISVEVEELIYSLSFRSYCGRRVFASDDFWEPFTTILERHATAGDHSFYMAGDFSLVFMETFWQAVGTGMSCMTREHEVTNEEARKAMWDKKSEDGE